MKHENLTILYYTSNENSDYFMENTQRILLEAVGDTPIVCVSFKPTMIGNNCTNIVVGEGGRSNYKLYGQILTAAKATKTKYCATAEDDMLYSKEHFDYRPKDEVFAYNINKWSIFSWIKPPVFSYRPRKLMNSLIVTRDALVKNLQERYDKYPVFEEIPKDIWSFYFGEPGRFETHLGIPRVPTEEFESSIPNVMFSTSEALGYLGLGTRKAHSKIKKDRVEPWGSAESVLKLYKQ